MLLDGQYNIQQQYLDKTKGNGYEGMTPEQEAYWRQTDPRDLTPVVVDEPQILLPNQLDCHLHLYKKKKDRGQDQGYLYLFPSLPELLS